MISAVFQTVNEFEICDTGVLNCNNFETCLVSGPAGTGQFYILQPHRLIQSTRIVMHPTRKHKTCRAFSLFTFSFWV